MAQGPGRSSHRKVELSSKADGDRFAIYIYTEQQWGTAQAEAYNEFLQQVMQSLADAPQNAAVVPARNNTRVFIARWQNARDGHRIFFRETEHGILVLRILHTAMNWTDHTIE